MTCSSIWLIVAHVSGRAKLQGPSRQSARNACTICSCSLPFTVGLREPLLRSNNLYSQHCLSLATISFGQCKRLTTTNRDANLDRTLRSPENCSHFVCEFGGHGFPQVWIQSRGDRYRRIRRSKGTPKWPTPGSLVSDLLGLRDGMQHCSWLVDGFWPSEDIFVHRRQGIDAATRSHLLVHAADTALRRVDVVCQLPQAEQQIIKDGRRDTSSAPSCPRSASTPHFQQHTVTASAPKLVLIHCTFCVCLSFSTLCVLRAGPRPFCETTSSPRPGSTLSELASVSGVGGCMLLRKIGVPRAQDAKCRKQQTHVNTYNV